MMMGRRDFVKWLALICAGVAAKPEQIEAFERYYEANTPKTERHLVAVDELWVSGMANVSTRVMFTLHLGDDNDPLRLGMNAFGGIIRWVAKPDQMIVVARNDIRLDVSSPEFDITAPDGGKTLSESHARYWMRENLEGHLSYIDQNAKRRYVRLSELATFTEYLA